MTIPAGTSLATTASLINSQTQTVVILTFNSSGWDTDSGGSLTDGNFLLTVAADKVHAQAGGNTYNMAANYRFGAAAADNFFRWFGAADGTRTGDLSDATALKTAAAKPANYVPYLDFNHDGKIDSTDTTAFQQLYYLKTLVWAAPHS